MNCKVEENTFDIRFKKNSKNKLKLKKLFFNLN